MKLDEFKNDLKVFDKLKNDEYRNDIDIAYRICDNLDIIGEGIFTIYQQYIKELEKVTFEDIRSYRRLLNVEYYISIAELKSQLKNDSKIITFPKVS